MQVDFYRIATIETLPRWHMICRLIAKAYQKKHHIHIHCNNQSDAHTLDELLWTFKDDSFIPHTFIGDGPDFPPPVRLGYDNLIPTSRDILINLAQAIPSFHKQFKRILEVVSDDALQKEICREHYRLYREWGYELNTHQVSNNG